MRETPRAYTARTGRRYAPPAWLRMLADPLDADRPCPTLFRYPGACGLDDLFAGRLTTLGPEGDREVYLAARSSWEDVIGAQHFGTLAVLAPLHHDPCETSRPAVFLGVNRPWEREAAAWVPPSRLASPLPWDELRTAREVEEALGGDLDEERRIVAESVARYLREVAAINQAGVPRAPRPWCETPEEERRRLLAEAGVAPIW